MKNTIDRYYTRRKPFYNQKADIEVKLKEYSDTFNIELMNIWDNKPDCKIGHFGYNIYFRTRYGIKAKKYKSLKTMSQAIRQSVKKHGLNVEYFCLKKGYDQRILKKL